MTYYLNLNEIATALNKRVIIEKEKLDFEKEVFNYNKQIEESNLKINTNMVNTLEQCLNRINTLQETINIISKNQDYLYIQLQELKEKEENNASK